MPRWWLLVGGVVSIIAGVLTLVWPSISAFVLLSLIAAWSVVGGVVLLTGVMQMPEEVPGKWLLIANSVLSILFGIALFVWPQQGAVAMIWVIGLYAALYGILTIVFAIQVRRYRS